MLATKCSAHATSNLRNYQPMHFRKDINGLRALSVVAVMLYHFGFNMTGGFSGVDVFFVISGFLMTSIIVGNIEAGKFSLFDFYMSRGRRIIPPLAVLCLMVLVWGWFYLYPTEYKSLGKHAKSTIGFVSNITYFKEAGYFDADSSTKWLLHTWSLSVEWQFYFLYPLLILTIRKLTSNKGLIISLILISAVSLGCSVYYSNNSPDLAFYSIHTRAWEMIAGGLLYFLPFTITGIKRTGIELTGLFLIIFSFFYLTPDDVWPGSLALLPVIGASLIIISCRETSFFFSIKPVQWLGTNSYSIYLWHWPIVVYLAHTDRSNQIEWMLSGVALSLIFGHLSYRYIESIMSGKVAGFRQQRTALIGLLIMTLMTLGISNHIKIRDGITENYRTINSDERSMFVERYTKIHQSNIIEAYRVECDFYFNATSIKDAIDPSCVNTKSGENIFIWGDSHAQALSVGLRKSLERHYIVNQVATSGCAPSLRLAEKPTNYAEGCLHSNMVALEAIRKTKPKYVVMAQASNHEKTDWDEIADAALNAGAKAVFLIGPLPQWAPSLPIAIKLRHWNEGEQYITDKGLREDVIQTDNLLRKKYLKPGKVNYISLIENLCILDLCRAYAPDGETLMVVDSAGHLSVPGSEYIAKELLTKHFVTE